MSILKRSMVSSTRSVNAASRLSTISRHLSSSSSNMKQGEEVQPPAEPAILYSSEGVTRIYKLNRTKQLNALNHPMVSSLKDKVESWRTSNLCKTVIGRGSERAFCAGGDVKQLIFDLKDGKQTALEFFKDEFALNWSIARLGKPYVSIMDGVTMGGGCGIALPATMRIATSKTHFAMPETKIGYTPDVGVNYYLAQLDGSIGAWLAITGQDVYGRAVYELGLATHYVQPESIDMVVADICALENPTMSQVSGVISSAAPPPADSSLVNSKQTPDGHTPIRGDIRRFLDKTFKQDSIQKIYKSLEEAESNESLSSEVKAWAKEQKKYMDERSPTGMAVALEGYRRARSAKRLDVVLQNDIAAATGFVGSQRASEDFITGVTAVLVTRQKGRPEWNPSSISDPSLSPSNIVSKFFDKKSPHQSDRPNIVFKPEPTSKITSGPDSTWGQFRKYGLPSEREIESIVEGSAPGSGAFKVTAGEVVERVLEKRGEAGGSRAHEVAEWTKEVVGRLCEVKQNGYLNWKKAD